MHKLKYFTLSRGDRETEGILSTHQQTFIIQIINRIHYVTLVCSGWGPREFLDQPTNIKTLHTQISFNFNCQHQNKIGSSKRIPGMLHYPSPTKLTNRITQNWTLFQQVGKKPPKPRYGSNVENRQSIRRKIKVFITNYSSNKRKQQPLTHPVTTSSLSNGDQEQSFIIINSCS